MAPRINRYSFTAPLVLLGLAACAPAEDAGAGDSVPEAAEAQDNVAENPSEAILMADTAWLSVGSDGSVQTTFLDPGGRYRDFRNGVAADTGSWEGRPDGTVCLNPDEGRGDCWTSSAFNEDGSALVTSADGKRVELKRITYIAPPADEETGESS
jgi:hypothetical protein